MTSLWLRGGTVITMDAERRVIEGDVLVNDGVITAVGEVPDGRSIEAVDVSGCVVLPGFVQGHVHLGQALLRGLSEGRDLLPWLRERIWPLEAAHTHESAYWSGMLGAADCLLSGTTTIHEIGLVTHMDAIFAAIRDSGLRAVAGKCLMDRGEGVPPELIEPVENAMAACRALHAQWHGAEDGRIETTLCPRFILSCTDEMWEATVALAREHGVGIHTHLLEHPEEEPEVRAALGETQMGYLDRLGVLDAGLRIAHGVQFGREEAAVLDGRPMSICHCPSANLKLGSGIADLGELAQVPGIVLGIGCDGAPCNNDMDMLEEIRLAALLQQVRQGPGRWTAEQTLALATIEGARALGMDDRIGSLEVGKRGDLVVLDPRQPQSFGPLSSWYDRIVYGIARDAVKLVAVDGRVLVRDRRLVAMDEDALQRRPEEELRRLWQRFSEREPL